MSGASDTARNFMLLLRQQRKRDLSPRPRFVSSARLITASPRKYSAFLFFPLSYFICLFFIFIYLRSFKVYRLRSRVRCAVKVRLYDVIRVNLKFTATVFRRCLRDSEIFNVDNKNS